MSDDYIAISRIRSVMRKNADRAAFCRAKADEASDPVMKMSHLAEATGLLQANLNILEQLEEDGLDK